ncbi:MAG: TonB-dependent receptor [Alphaproteobacteria bacterium]|nr:TonB-dependent receptor [Alphaproteobacteria bacterium]
MKGRLLTGAAGLVYGVCGVIGAGIALPSAASADPQPIQEIVVNPDIDFRNRTETTNPVLSYDIEFFQRFEPISVGEMLKRVPGVAFTSDIGEYDAPQLRGLASSYTQILINGRRIPGSGADDGQRTFFVDRIPAELVERIEIIRSPGADMTSEGIGGVLNIILKDGAALEGGYARLGGAYYDDEEVRGSAAVGYGGRAGDITWWGSLDVQERRNPKQKVTELFDDTNTFTGERIFEDDTREGDDYAANGEMEFPLGAGTGRLTGFYVFTDREEREAALAFDSGTLVETADQLEDIDQHSGGLDGEGSFPLGGGTLGLSLGYATFVDDIAESERELAFEGPGPGDDELTLATEILDNTDQELSGGIDYSFKPWATGEIKVGVDILRKDRDFELQAFEREYVGGALDDSDSEYATFDIVEWRTAPFVVAKWQLTPTLDAEAGLRGEYLDRELEADIDGDLGEGSSNDWEFAPSLHVRYTPTRVDQFRASIARTIRLPEFDLLNPVTIDGPRDDDEFEGNPGLGAEKAWGLDVGYERRIVGNGIVGINVFYRDIEDVIELVGIADLAPGTLYTAENVGNGETYGVEFDLSAPLGFIGLPNTGLFGNLTWLDSEITDPDTGRDRQFQNQPNYIFNVGFIHNVPSLGVAFGATYSERGESEEHVPDEIAITSYDGNLDAFVEKRFGDSFVLRLSGTNLLDAEKLEEFTYFDSGAVDEYETEVEESGPVVLLTLRAAF